MSVTLEIRAVSDVNRRLFGAWRWTRKKPETEIHVIS